MGADHFIVGLRRDRDAADEFKTISDFSEMMSSLDRVVRESDAQNIVRESDAQWRRLLSARTRGSDDVVLTEIIPFPTQPVVTPLFGPDTPDAA